MLTHLWFRSLSKGPDQGIAQKAAVFEEAPAIFSADTHTSLSCHWRTLKQRLVLSRQCGWMERRMRCFFQSLLWYIVSLSSWAQNDEPRQADSPALSLWNGNAFAQWVSPECGQVNMAESLELAEHISRLYGWLVFYGLCGSCHRSS